jgi:type IV pilus assembly protein PilE
MTRPNTIASSTRHGVNSAGFSLIELMVTVVIVAILAAIAIPSYNAQILKSRRTDAKAALLDLAGREERYFSTNNGTYTAAAASLGYTGTFPVNIGSNYYQVNVPATTVVAGTTTTLASFIITATPINSQASDAGCTSFTIDSTGKQSATGSDSANCWK